VRLALAASDVGAELRARYLGDASAAVYLIRPDQHVAARWPKFDETAVRGALRNATGR
jgi:3-(3-hydroxy-phenyl)propionate hydroxylase